LGGSAPDKRTVRATTAFQQGHLIAYSTRLVVDFPMAACLRVVSLSLVGLALIGGSLGACRHGPNHATQWPPTSRSAGSEMPASETSDAANGPRANGNAATTMPVASTNPPAPWPPSQPPSVETDWCMDGISALDETSCYALPDAPSRT